MSTTNVGVPVLAVQTSAAKRRSGLLDQYFYFLMALLIPAIVVYGFSFTIGKNLIHPVIPRPSILYVHAAVFSGWLAFFLLQSALVRTRNVNWHRSIGWFGAAFGGLIPVVGVATAIAMARFDIAQLHQSHVEMDLMIPLWDMAAFTAAFALAICWRQKPEYHRRLVLIATCSLTAAAFGRFPPYLLNPVFFYAGVDLLVLFGAVRDCVVCRKIHPVYLYALPALIAGQAIVMYTNTHDLQYWLRFARAILA
jgi:hypothetical protein